MLSLITTCKNRLAHIKETLPLMAQQSHAEVIVVDYGCEQGTSAWVNEAFPSVRTIRVDDAAQFSAARARNIGAAHAHGDLICFIDADVLLNTDLGAWALDGARHDVFYVNGNVSSFELFGFIICSKQTFDRIGGYDEAYIGWGGEDRDFYERLEMAGIEKVLLPEDALSAISHGDDLRMLGNKDPSGFTSKEQALALQHCYKLLKFDIIRLTGTVPDLVVRKQLHAKVRAAHGEALSRGQTHFTLTLTIPPRPSENRHARCERTLHYKVPVVLPSGLRAAGRSGDTIRRSPPTA